MHLGFEGLSDGFCVLSKFRSPARQHIWEKNDSEKRGEFSKVKDRVPEGFFQISGLILESLGHKVASRI